MLKNLAVIIILVTFSIIPNAYAISNVLINEFLAHPSSGNKEWVEFYNPSSIDLSNYFLDDDTSFASDIGSSPKKTLSSIITTDPTHPYLEFDSFLNNSGDYVVLFANDGTIIDQYQYTQDPGENLSIGRTPDGNDEFVNLAQPSKGLSNGQALPSPTPTSSPTSSPVQTPSSSLKSPSPSPAPTQTITKSPSPKPSSEVLGEKQESTPSPISISSGPTSASPSLFAFQSALGIGSPGILIATGLMLMGLSIGFYLWYKRVSNQALDGQEKSNNQNG